MPPSQSPPAVAVGGCIWIDSQSLTVKSVGGNFCYIDSVDEFSGDRHVTPCAALTAAAIFAALMYLVYTRYNAHGHRVTHMVSDSLPAFEAVIPMLGALGITSTLTPPWSACSAY